MRRTARGTAPDRTRRPARAATGSRKAAAPEPTARTRSFPCPDDLWQEVEGFAADRGLGSSAAAARLLLRSGLRVERRVRELEAARDWQIEQAWSELQAIAGGDRRFGGWSEIERAAARARLRIREREAALARSAADA